MARPRKVPAVLVEATVRGNAKLAALPNDTARLGFFYVVLGEAKLAQPIPGQFASRAHFIEVAGRFASFLEAYISVGVIELGSRLCARCVDKWSAMPPRRDALVIHDWHEHQYDPRKIERQREYEERQRGEVSDGVSDAHSDGVSDANPTSDSRGGARSGAPNVNVEPRKKNGISPHGHGESNRDSAAGVERVDVQALLDRGWRRVTKAQRATLAEIADRHGEAWAADLIATLADDAEPLAAVMEADRAWQATQVERITAEEQAWEAVKAEERADVEAITKRGRVAPIAEQEELSWMGKP
jgi:hypothetical protein